MRFAEHTSGNDRAVGVSRQRSTGAERQRSSNGRLLSRHSRDAWSRIACQACSRASSNCANHTKQCSPSRTGRRGNVFSLGSVSNVAHGGAPLAIISGATTQSKKSAKPATALWRHRIDRDNSQSGRRPGRIAIRPRRSVELEAGPWTRRTKQSNVVGVDHRRVRRIAVRVPDGAVVERSQRSPARIHVRKAAQPCEHVRIIDVAELRDDVHAAVRLRLHEFAVEQRYQILPPSRVQRVPAQLDDWPRCTCHTGMIALKWSARQRHLLSFGHDHFAGNPAVKATASPEILSLVPIDRRSRLPLQQQIYDGIRNAILARLLRAGQRVPATRALAADLGVSRLPVLTAYDQLLHEGYLEGRIGSGTFVSASLPDDELRSVSASPLQLSRSPKPRPHVAGAKHVRVLPPRMRDDGGMRPFRVSLPALDQFPSTIWSRLVARHAHALSPARMAYSDPAGLGSFRSAVAEHLRTARAVRCEAEHVLVVSGSQAALCICAMVLLKRGDVVAMEEPGYGGARAALATTGAVTAPVRIDRDGIDVTALHALGSRVRAAYVTPSHQYPIGTAMTATRRLELLEWAAQHSAWILEDDYDSEFRYVSRPLGSLQGMDANERVIYIGTFSKVLFPSIRVGYIVVPPSLWTNFVEARETLDIFSPTLYQLALRDFIREGHFARHLRRMRALYLRRRTALLEGLDAHCGEHLIVHNADAGLHVSTFLAEGVDDRAVMQPYDRARPFRRRSLDVLRRRRSTERPPARLRRLERRDYRASDTHARDGAAAGDHGAEIMVIALSRGEHDPQLLPGCGLGQGAIQ